MHQIKLSDGRWVTVTPEIFADWLGERRTVSDLPKDVCANLLALEAAAKKGWSLVAFVEVESDGVQAPGGVTVCYTGGFLAYAVHFFNAQDQSFYGLGDNYFATRAEADLFFFEKAKRYTGHHKKG